MTRTRNLLLAAVAAATFAGAAYTTVQAAAAPGAAVTAAVADARRPAADKARDANRKPAETVAFAGVKPGDKVAELAPGGGYYTRVLAATVGPQGKVYAMVTPAQAARPGGLDALNALVAAYGNVVIVQGAYTELKTPEPVDVVWTTENYHDFHNGAAANIAALNGAVFAALKPGGTFFVEDHSSAPGAGAAATSAVHRMDEAVAKTELQAAGFRLDGQSNHLASAADDRSKNPENAVTPSDRFALRMKKPG